MARRKKKPDYNPQSIMSETLKAVSDCYTSLQGGGNNSSLRDVADKFDFTHLKVRKLLITAGVYHTDISDEVNQLKTEGKTIPQIMEITGLSRASVHSYLPYTKTVYNADELSLNAERLRKYRSRQEAVRNIERYFEEASGKLSDLLWEAIVQFDSYPFHTVRGMKFRYTVKGQEMFVNRKEKSITRATVDLALENVLRLNRDVSGPKKLNVFGASYLYPVFKRLM